MRDFNHEFDNNEMNNTENNQNTNNENNTVNHTPVSNTPENHAPVSDGTVSNTPAEEKPVQPAENNVPNTGSYSYTGDKLTDSRTNFNQPQQGGYQNNPYDNYQNNSNPYQQQNSGQQQNTVYNMPHMNGSGEISYSPNNSQEKPKKEKKKAKTVQFTKAGVAVLCSATICLSAAAGFLGAFAASSAVGNGNVTVQSDGDSSTASSGTAVMYRSVSTTGLGSAQNGSMTYQDVAGLVQDSVVEIVTEFNNTSLWFQYVTSGAGSGVILSEDGYVITNNHVIYDDSSASVADNITVRLRNGEEYKAEVIGTDSDSDVAVLKIEATGLTPAVCGNSDSLVVGEEVVAVGNPLGELGGTVTNGIVSATNREIDMGDVTMNLIQTNAAVNPGNSGGGLFNMNGELIGIVNAKSSGTDIEGLGFAIPVKDALNVAEQLLEYGYVRGKVMIGVAFLDATDTTVSRYYGLKSGIYVSSLTEGYNDDNLKPGDRVIAIDGNEVSAYEDITSIVKASSVGDILKFQVYRDGKLIEVDVEVFEKVPESVSAVEFESETAEETEPQQSSPSRMPW